MVAQKRGATTFISVFSRSTEFIGGKHRQLWLEFQVSDLKAIGLLPHTSTGNFCRSPWTTGLEVIFTPNTMGQELFSIKNEQDKDGANIFGIMVSNYRTVPMIRQTDVSNCRNIGTSKHRYVEIAGRPHSSYKSTACTVCVQGAR